MRVETISRDLARNFVGLDQEQVKAEEDRIEKYIVSVVAGIQKKSNR